MGNEKPPGVIPSNLRDAFTLRGQIRVLSRYIDSTDKAVPAHYEKDFVNKLVGAACNKMVGTYPETDHWLHVALKYYSIAKQSIVVLGSVTPWYEAICLAYGARPVTVEYAERTTNHPILRIMHSDLFFVTDEQFDAAISISSIEHDGLGRYGDPINPNGDLQAMRLLKRKLKPGGLLFLGIPIGLDTLVWNAHRIYGEIRLPLLLEGWELVDRFYYKDSDLKVDTGDQAGFQPVLILKNKDDDG